MFLEGLFNRESVPVLEKLAAFTEARQHVLADNIANLDTPGYRTKRLSFAAFQQALQEAIDHRRQQPAGRLELPATAQFAVGPDGFLRVFPTTEGRDNILFHDRTNHSVETQMAEVAKNALLHEVALSLLRQRYDELMRAVRQRP